MNFTKATSVARFILLLLVIATLLAFSICGVYINDDAQLHGIFDEGTIRLGLDLAGGSSITYQAKNEGGDVTSSGMNSVLEVMRNRLDNAGFTEALVYLYGDDMIVVELPSVEDPSKEALNFMQTAKLEFKVNGERAYEVYEVAQRHGLFLTFHTGVHWHRLSDYAMLLFDDLTYDFPDLKFSMEHMGGYCFFKDALAVMVNRRGNAKDPHVFSGWTSIYDPGLWYLTDEQLYTMVALAGETTHTFGTDFPHNKGPQLKAAIERIKGLNISEEAKARILGQNLADALGVAL